MDIKALAGEIRTGVQRILGDHLKSLLLYGSYAREDYDEESDIDLMALVDLKYDEIAEYKKPLDILASRVGLKFDIMISLSIMNENTIRKNVGVVPYYHNVLREGVDLLAG